MSFKEECRSPKKSALIYYTSSSRVVLNSGRNNSPLFGRRAKKKKMRKKDVFGTSFVNTGVFLLQVSALDRSLDPDIKGLRESFPPFKARAYAPALEALISATGLPPMSRNYTLLEYLSPLVCRYFTTVDALPSRSST